MRQRSATYASYVLDMVWKAQICALYVQHSDLCLTAPFFRMIILCVFYARRVFSSEVCMVRKCNLCVSNFYVPVCAEYVLSM